VVIAVTPEADAKNVRQQLRSAISLAYCVLWNSQTLALRNELTSSVPSGSGQTSDRHLPGLQRRRDSSNV
jgi:hypothetical protein